ncbi:acetamidase/formamidase family protein [Streptosporangium sp. NBC_01469]|uniref:acetamidase/formamidase family protein n=1 Tax=Streptosporangium sp. NBC_01469 TaxID=2903898 RepID=UPI002E2E186B|nr:acetamidase/formamidase family protein [Streptosporangium sp. NBC_01469]
MFRASRRTPCRRCVGCSSSVTAQRKADRTARVALAPTYQRACLHAIDYLTAFDYSPEQAYLLLGAAPIEGRLSGVVDIPNSCATVYLPAAIFDFDVRPGASGPLRVPEGAGAPHAGFD